MEQKAIKQTQTYCFSNTNTLPPVPQQPRNLTHDRPHSLGREFICHIASSLLDSTCFIQKLGIPLPSFDEIDST